MKGFMRFGLICGTACLTFIANAGAQGTDNGLHKGMEMYKLGNYSATMQAMDQTISGGGGTAEAYLLRGKAKFNMKSCECGTEDFDSAIALNANMAEAYAARSIVKSCSGNMKSAKEDAERALQLDGSLPMVYLAHGYQQMLDSNYNEAITDFNAALKKSPEWHSQLYTYRGMAYMGKGKYDFAKRDFNRAIKINPSNKELYLLRADANVNKGWTRKALKDYDHYLSLNPNNHSVRFLKALVMLDANRDKQAVSELSRAIEQSPKQADYYMARGIANARMKNYPAALADFKLADTLMNSMEKPRFVVTQQDFHYYYGMSCFNCDLDEQAINQLNQLVQLDPQYEGEAYYYKCKAKNKSNVADGACEDCSKALSMGFKSARRYVKKHCTKPAQSVSVR